MATSTTGEGQEDGTVQEVGTESPQGEGAATQGNLGNCTHNLLRSLLMGLFWRRDYMSDK